MYSGACYDSRSVTVESQSRNKLNHYTEMSRKAVRQRLCDWHNIKTWKSPSLGCEI